MRKSALAFCTVAAGSMLAAATLFAPSVAQATPFAALSGLKAAVHESSSTESVAYVCRRGRHGPKCYHVYRGYYGAYASSPYQARREPSPYFDQPQWGGPSGQK
jgi:hypothetical protein